MNAPGDGASALYSDRVTRQIARAGRKSKDLPETFDAGLGRQKMAASQETIIKKINKIEANEHRMYRV